LLGRGDRDQVLPSIDLRKRSGSGSPVIVAVWFAW
jgi:hypothetical protein